MLPRSSPTLPPSSGHAGAHGWTAHPSTRPPALQSPGEGAGDVCCLTVVVSVVQRELLQRTPKLAVSSRRWQPRQCRSSCSIRCLILQAGVGEWCGNKPPERHRCPRCWPIEQARLSLCAAQPACAAHQTHPPTMPTPRSTHLQRHHGPLAVGHSVQGVPAWQHSLLPHPRSQQQAGQGPRRGIAQQGIAPLNNLVAPPRQVVQRLALRCLKVNVSAATAATAAPAVA